MTNINTIRFKEFEEVVLGQNGAVIPASSDAEAYLVGYRIVQNGSTTTEPEIRIPIDDVDNYIESVECVDVKMEKVALLIPEDKAIQDYFDGDTEALEGLIEDSKAAEIADEDAVDGFISVVTHTYKIIMKNGDNIGFDAVSWVYIPSVSSGGGGGAYTLSVGQPTSESPLSLGYELLLKESGTQVSHLPLDVSFANNKLTLSSGGNILSETEIVAGANDLIIDNNKTLKLYDTENQQAVGSGVQLYFGVNDQNGTLEMKANGNIIGSYSIPAGPAPVSEESFVYFNPELTEVNVTPITTGSSSGEFVEDTAYEALHPEVSKAFKLNLDVLTLQGEEGPRGPAGPTPEIRFNVQQPILTGVASFAIGNGTANQDGTVVTYPVTVTLPDNGGGGGGGQTPVLRNVIINDPDELGYHNVLVADSTYSYIYDLYLDIAEGPQGPQGIQGIQGPAGPAGQNGANGTNGRGIQSINGPVSSGNVDTYTIVFTDGTSQTYSVVNGTNGTNGTNGAPGADGKSIAMRTYTMGQNSGWYIYFYKDGEDASQNRTELHVRYNQHDLVLTATDYTSGTATQTQSITVPIVDGDDGVGISNIAQTASVGNVDTYTITLTNGNTYNFTVTNGTAGANGAPGANGRGITNITGPVVNGLAKTYTINYSDNTTSTYIVNDGTPGEDGTAFELYRVVLCGGNPMIAYTTQSGDNPKRLGLLESTGFPTTDTSVDQNKTYYYYGAVSSWATADSNVFGIHNPVKNKSYIYKYNVALKQYEMVTTTIGSVVAPASLDDLNDIISQYATSNNGGYIVDVCPDTEYIEQISFAMRYGVFGRWHKNGEPNEGVAASTYDGINLLCVKAITESIPSFVFTVKVYKNIL